MVAQLDNVRFNPSAGGTTDWTYSSAVLGYQSPTAAGVVNGSTYNYFAISADSTQWEVGRGAYNTGTGVLSRTTVLFNSLGTTAKVSFSAAPQVAVVVLAEDLANTVANGRTGATTLLGYYAGLQPLKLSSTIIAVNPGSFADSTGSQIISTSNVLQCDLTASKITSWVAAASVASGGSGGTNGTQTVTVVGGTGTAATLNVTVSGGAITAVNSITTAGNYTFFPSSPAAVTGAGLTGATVNLTETVPQGGCLVGAMTAATGSGDFSDIMLYLCTRNSDGAVALVADVANVYGGATAATITNGSNSWTTGGPPCGFFGGTPVRLTTTGTLPSGFATNTDYYAVNETNGQNSTTFGLSATRGGTAISAGSTFSGAITVHYGVQDHLDSIYGAGVWTVRRRVHFAFRWFWQWPGPGGGIPDFTADPRADYVHLTYGGWTTPWQILNGGTATSFTNVSCVNIVSNLNRVVRVLGVVTGTTSGVAYVASPGGTNFKPIASSPVPGSGSFAYVDVQMDSSGNIQYEVSGGAVLNLYVVGWYFVDPS